MLASNVSTFYSCTASTGCRGRSAVWRKSWKNSTMRASPSNRVPALNPNLGDQFARQPVGRVISGVVGRSFHNANQLSVAGSTDQSAGIAPAPASASKGDC
jgi:hypothetical protein